MNAQLVIAIAVIVGLFALLIVPVWQLGKLAARDDRSRGRFLQLMHPASIVSMLILLGVLFLLGMAILDLDKGRVLIGMGRTSFARGLITYLFAIVTIGTAVVLVLSALLGTAKDKLDSGKEVLGLLLGVFGTIIGFYFASELSDSEGRGRLNVSPILAATEVAQGAAFTITVSVQGGALPYRFAVGLGTEDADDYAELVRPDGWIVKEITVPETTPLGVQPLRVSVQDASGERNVVQTLITVRARAPAP